jgi:hypothetical protein
MKLLVLLCLTAVVIGEVTDPLKRLSGKKCFLD